MHNKLNKKTSSWVLGKLITMCRIAILIIVRNFENSVLALLMETRLKNI